MMSDPSVLSAVLQARSHLALLPGLPVELSGDAAALAELARPYCLCQSLYDEARPMLGCDDCEDWFHFDCVGVVVDDAPAQYRCVATAAGGGGVMLCCGVLCWCTAWQPWGLK